ncbi:hypothetical protein [Amycolatopsis sp.]|uniref:hypothetical protein n=1 Tax=Amycolatopsis sp. TaxID=37632 RepID=UPI0039C89F80
MSVPLLALTTIGVVGLTFVESAAGSIDTATAGAADDGPVPPFVPVLLSLPELPELHAEIASAVANRPAIRPDRVLPEDGKTFFNNMSSLFGGLEGARLA